MSDVAMPIGHDTMSSALVDADAFHRWAHAWVQPWVRGRVLDVGGGTGNHMAHLRCDTLLSVDLSPACVAQLRRRFGDRPGWTFEVADFCDPAIVGALGRYDTVLSSNVFEHIADDRTVFEHAARMLVPGGHLVLVLPAHRRLFGALDVLAGHHRRYDRTMLRARLAGLTTPMEVVQLRYVNLVGAVGWWINGRLPHRDLSSGSVNGQIRLFDRWLVPLLRRLEGERGMPFGQSVVCVARRCA